MQPSLPKSYSEHRTVKSLCCPHFCAGQTLQKESIDKSACVCTFMFMSWRKKWFRDLETSVITGKSTPLMYHAEGRSCAGHAWFGIFLIVVMARLYLKIHI